MRVVPSVVSPPEALLSVLPRQGVLLFPTNLAARSLLATTASLVAPLLTTTSTITGIATRGRSPFQFERKPGSKFRALKRDNTSKIFMFDVLIPALVTLLLPAILFSQGKALRPRRRRRCGTIFTVDIFAPQLILFKLGIRFE